jgi:hypothetical protein
VTEHQRALGTPANIPDEWYRRCSAVAVGHYKMAERLSSRHRWLSNCAAALSAIVGTTVFVTLQGQPELWVKMGTGLLSVVSAVLAVLATNMGLQDRAERHRIAGARYNAVGRQLEQMTMGATATLDDLTPIRERLDTLSAEMPHIPKKVHKEIANHDDLSRWGK